MKKTTFLFIAFVIMSCTENNKARNFGGTETVKIKSTERFINLTWKKNNLWIIVEDTLTRQIYAKEKSSFGVWEGKIIIEQSKP